MKTTVEVSELQGPLTELMKQVGGQSGRVRFDEFKRWLKRVEPAALEAWLDLSVPCKTPFYGGQRVSPAQSGVVKLEKRLGDLYLDGKKIVLFFSKAQKGGGCIVGLDLRLELETHGGNLGGIILDYLVAHPALWPSSWERDEKGNVIFVHFWGDIFRYSGDFCVRRGYWSRGKVVPDYGWLKNGFGRQCPAASIAS